jgi:hypothetical protein
VSRAPKGWSVPHLVIHELVHGSMGGTDIREIWYRKDDGNWTSSLNGWAEGPATVIGQTYQTRNGNLGEGQVFVRCCEAPATLDKGIEDADAGIYTKQDFIAWVARKYNRGSLSYVSSIYEAMSDKTNGRYGLLAGEYRVLYRQAVDGYFQQSFGKGLPDVYAEFALDRAYRHSAEANLRATDTRIAGELDTTLFDRKPVWDLGKTPGIALTDLVPLSTQYVDVVLPPSVRAAGSFDLKVAVTGADLAPAGLRVKVFRESGGVQVAAGGEIDVQDVSRPVKIPVGLDGAGQNVDSLTILVSNCSIENRTATVSFGEQGYYIFVGSWAPPGKQGNDCYTPTTLFAPPIYAAVFMGSGGALTADPGYIGLLDSKYGYTFSGSVSYSGDTATASFKLGWTDFDEDEGTPNARLDLDVSFWGTRQPIPPTADPGVNDYFTGETNIVFKTSAPGKPCSTNVVSTGAFVGPCPKPHCQK